jgi:hypothetical protein
VRLDEPERGLDRELVARVQGAVDALSDEQEVFPERGRPLRFGDVLDEHDDVHGILDSSLAAGWAKDTRGDEGACTS